MFKVDPSYSAAAGDGSHSEIEVARQSVWGPEQIHDRGNNLLTFMEKRWDFRFGDADKQKLLFLGLDEWNE